MARHLAIIIFGPPGSGKGTQANEITRRFEGLHHFDTGREIERAIKNPQMQDDPVVQIERERFDKGYIADTPFVLKIVRDGVTRIAASGSGIVFSGSPRVREEAEFLIPHLFQIYGEGSILVFHMNVREETSIFRNTRRRVCSDCGEPLLWSEENEKLAYCARCGGKLVTRTLDIEEAIRLRLVEYRRQTEKILDYFKAVGIPIYDIDAEKAPDVLSNEIASIIEKHLQ